MKGQAWRAALPILIVMVFLAGLLAGMYLWPVLVRLWHR